MAENIAVKIPWEGWKATGPLGHGAFGRVYRIERDLFGINEKAAMKVIRIPKDADMIEDLYSSGYDEQSVSEWCRSRRDDIQKEYALMTHLKGHTNIVSCDDIAVESHTEDPGYDIYIRMELLTPLQQVLKTKELSEQDIIRIGKDICKALTVCEKYNIIHRDIKPQNILVNETGDYKLGDFGVARTMEHTTNATVAGTENYMAPEVIRREKYGKDVDTYSLGLVLYWLLNKRTMPFLTIGAVPQIADLEAARTRRITGEPLPEPATGSRELKAIVLKACKHDRNARYSSAGEMLKDLSLLDSMGSSATSAKYVPEQDDYTDGNESTVGMFSWRNYSGGKTVGEPESQEKPEPGQVGKTPTRGKTASEKKAASEPKPDTKKAAEPKTQPEPKKVATPKPSTKKDESGATGGGNKSGKFTVDDLKELLPYFLATALMVYIVASRIIEINTLGESTEDLPVLYGMGVIAVGGFLALILPKIPYISAIFASVSGFMMGMLIPMYIVGKLWENYYENTPVLVILSLGVFVFGIFAGKEMYSVFEERH